jgi:DNA polymerase-3 subunit chi
MTRVDFYVLPTDSPRERALFACRLVEKAFGLGHSIWIETGTDDEARALDELLWTFHDRAFVPHARAAGGADEPVLIGAGETPAAPRDLLVNLAAGVPPWIDGFARVAEVVDDAAERKAAGRERFRAYRERGFALETHKL